MNSVDKLYELEELVANNGDESRINQLRKELGFEPSNNTRKWNFTVEEYIALRAKGLIDKDIRKMHGISTATLVRYKKEAGLTKEKIRQLLLEYYKVC